MTSFRTEFNTRLHKSRIDLSSKMLTIGSCFSDSIGLKLQDNKLNTLINPFGTIYNPVSIHQVVSKAIASQLPADDLYLNHDEITYHYDFHSSFAASGKQPLQAQLNDRLNEVHHFLENCNYVLITYGTAWVHEHIETKQIVSNCHKQPSVLFKKQLLTPEQIISSFHAFRKELQQFNPDMQIILTVSPVRHLKDTMELNSVSKSLLRWVCHSLTITSDNVHYFPAYEIMMDDLRDYRFYSSDMLHPSSEAEKYIWEKFTQSYFTAETQDILQEWQSVKKMLNHKPFHVHSAAHQNFLKETLTKLQQLSLHINTDEEIKSIKKRLNT